MTEAELSRLEAAADAKGQAQRDAATANNETEVPEGESEGVDGLADSDDAAIASLEKELFGGGAPRKEAANDEDAPAPKPKLRAAPVKAEPKADVDTELADAKAEVAETDEVETPDGELAPEQLAALDEVAAEVSPKAPAPTPAAEAPKVEAKAETEKPKADAPVKVDHSDLVKLVTKARETLGTEEADTYVTPMAEALAEARENQAKLAARLDKIEGGNKAAEARAAAEKVIPKLRDLHTTLNTLHPAIFGTVDFDKAKRMADAGQDPGIDTRHLAAREFVRARVVKLEEAGITTKRAVTIAYEELCERIKVKPRAAAEDAPTSTTPKPKAAAPARAQPVAHTKSNTRPREDSGRFSRGESEALPKDEAIDQLAKELRIPR